MKTFWITKKLLCAGFIAYIPLSGYAHIHPNPSDNMDSRETYKFSLDPQEVLAVEEITSQIKEGLQNLEEAGDIQGMFILPEKESVLSLSEPTSSERMLRVAFLDTARKCFIYDSMTKEMVLCDEEDEALVKESEEVLTSSLSYTPSEALQTAGIGDFICSNKPAITMGIAIGVIGALAGGIAVGGIAVGGSVAIAGGTGAILTIVAAGSGVRLIVIEELKREIGIMTGTAATTVLATMAVGAAAGAGFGLGPQVAVVTIAMNSILFGFCAGFSSS